MCTKFGVRLTEDRFPPNPRTESDHLATFVCFHRRYRLGDKHEYRLEEGWDKLERQIIMETGGCVIIPLYLYDHSGITISTTPFSCRWDSGQVGFAFMPRQVILDNFSKSKSDRPRLSKKMGLQAADAIRAEVEEYDKYLRGDVWVYEITDGEGNLVESCGGFFGKECAAAEAATAVMRLENQNG